MATVKTLKADVLNVSPFVRDRLETSVLKLNPVDKTKIFSFPSSLIEFISPIPIRVSSAENFSEKCVSMKVI